jgi:hypothetical protein
MLYFFPTIISVVKKKLSTNAIFAVNIIPIIGWIIALIWALKIDRVDQVEVKYGFKHYFFPAIAFGMVILGMITFEINEISHVSVSSTSSVQIPAPNLPGSQWSYTQTPDKMGKGVTHQASVSSSNTVNFEFPYSGDQHATLTLRNDPRRGKDIIFNIEKGQLLCRSYEDSSILVRFDDESSIKFSVIGAADNSTETAFIRNYDRFVSKMLKAKRVRISMEIYHQGAPVFDFDVSNFDSKKY